MSVDPLAQMAFPFPQTLDDSSEWITTLQDAFADPKRTSGFLPLAEEALRDHPGDALILCLAATAALLDHRPKWALIYLKRYAKRYVPGESNHLLQALAVAQEGRFVAALRILQRHDLTRPEQALRFFPGGWERREWLRGQLGRILREGPPNAPGVRFRSASVWRPDYWPRPGPLIVRAG